MKEQLERYKEDYKFLFEMEGVKRPFFRLKFAFNGKDIGLFENELSNKDGVYIELTDREFNRIGKPELWYLPYHEDYATRYGGSQSTAGMRYNVPISELQNITLKWITPELPVNGEAGTDIPLKEITAKDIAAIIWRIPISDKSMINNLIVKYHDTTKTKGTRK